MSNEALVAVTIRVVGLWAAVLAIAIAGSTVRSFINAEPSLPVEAIPAAAVWLALAIYMVVAPSHLARRLLPKDYEGQPDSRLTLDGFKSITLGALGLFLIITAISSLGMNLLSWADLLRGGFAQSFRSGLLVGIFIKLAAGIWLLTGAKGLGGVFGTRRKGEAG